MRSLEFNVTSTAVTPNTAVIGNAGEHNVTKLNFKVDGEITDVAQYFRLSIGDFRSEKLYAQNSTVSYSLPRSVLQSGTVLLQLDGYNTENGEINRIFKSSLITAEVGVSVCAAQDIPEKMERDVDGAIAELTHYVEKGEKIVSETENNILQLEEIKSRVEEKSAEVENDRNEVEEARQYIDTKVAEAQLSAKSAAENMRLSQNSATEAETSAQISELAKNETKAHSESARTSAEISREMANAAANSAVEAENSKIAAQNYAADAKESAERITFITKTFVWEEHDASKEPKLRGKEARVDFSVVKGEKYGARVRLNPQEGYDQVAMKLLSREGNNATDPITATLYAVYDPLTNCYEAEFEAKRDTVENEIIELYVAYPYKVGEDNSISFDTSCTYGNAEILYYGNFHNLIENQNDKIYTLKNDISNLNNDLTILGGNVSNLSGEVSALKEDVDRLSPSPKEIYKAEGLDLNKIGGTETECCYGFDKNLQHNVELKANDEYIFSIPHSLVGNGEMSISIREIGIVKLKHNGDSYTGIYTPTKDVYTFTLYELKIYGASVFSTTIDLHIEHLSPLAKKFGDIDSALDGIISIQESLIGGDTQ